MKTVSAMLTDRQHLHPAAPAQTFRWSWCRWGDRDRDKLAPTGLWSHFRAAHTLNVFILSWAAGVSVMCVLCVRHWFATVLLNLWPDVCLVALILNTHDILLIFAHFHTKILSTDAQEFRNKNDWLEIIVVYINSIMGLVVCELLCTVLVGQTELYVIPDVTLALQWTVEVKCV